MHMSLGFLRGGKQTSIYIDDIRVHLISDKPTHTIIDFQKLRFWFCPKGIRIVTEQDHNRDTR